MDPARFHAALEAQRAAIASLPPSERAALEALAEETAARFREISASREGSLRAAERLEQAHEGLVEAATRLAGGSARALDGVQDALIDLNFVALDLEAKNRERGGSR